MFSWLTGRGSNPHRSSVPSHQLFGDDPCIVVPTEQLPADNRLELERTGCLTLTSNMHERSQWSIYYEILYTKNPSTPKTQTPPTSFSYLIYHNKSKRDATEMFTSAKVVVNELELWLLLHNNKELVGDRLRAIMLSLKLNRAWGSAHVAARLGTFDGFFSEGAKISDQVINCQVKPDMYTPLLLAIKQCNTTTVRLILSRHSPNLDLLNSRGHSVLHYAAVSNPEIANLVLHQEGTFSRLLWRDSKGCTALHLACYAQKFDVLFVFLKFGLTVRMLTLSPPGSRPKQVIVSSDTDPAMAKVVVFNETDFEDLDCSDIYAAGSPLHWTRTKRLLEKLLSEYRFPLNGRNANGDTALHVASRRLRLKVVIGLLCAGANVNASNIFGNSPLHLAVRANDLVVPQALIVFDANLDARNYSNESVRHVAAKQCADHSQGDSNEAILYLLSALGAKRCPPIKVKLKEKEKETSKTASHNITERSKSSVESVKKETSTDKVSKNICSIGCSFSGDFEGNIAEKLFGIDQKYDHLFKDYLFGDIMKKAETETQEEKNKTNSTSGKPVNMLTLDGGGIKGLVTIQILCEIERYLKHPISTYFTWFAGTSTGSFICAFLATGMSLKTIRSHYFRFKDKVLTAEHGRPYSSEAIETVLRDIMGEKITMEQLLSTYGKYVLVPTSVANRRPMKLHLFQSYASPGEIFSETPGKEALGEQLLPDRDEDLVHANSQTHHTSSANHRRYESRKMEVWKALRASGAAPGYFRAYGDFLDGGLLANNPTLTALTGLQEHNAALRAVGRPEAETHNLKTVVSIGTGRSLLEETDVLDITGNYSTLRQIRQILLLLIYEITQTEQHVNSRAEAFCYGIGTPFFRLNAFLSEMVELDEQQEYRLINCLWETKRFMYYRREEVKALAKYLETVTVGLPKEKEEEEKKTDKKRQMSKKNIKQTLPQKESKSTEKQLSTVSANVSVEKSSEAKNPVSN